jgi:hypothetical protein
MKILAAALKQVAAVLFALLILFEEWGWEPLQRLMARIARLPLVRHLEAGIARLPPWAALVVLVLPLAVFVPAKLMAVWLIGSGRTGRGVAALIAAKVIGTALIARIFALTRPALLKLPWFAALYARWVTWKDTWLARVRASWAWRAGRAVARAARRQWARWREQWSP